VKWVFFCILPKIDRTCFFDQKADFWGATFFSPVFRDDSFYFKGGRTRRRIQNHIRAQPHNHTYIHTTQATHTHTHTHKQKMKYVNMNDREAAAVQCPKARLFKGMDCMFISSDDKVGYPRPALFTSGYRTKEDATREMLFSLDTSRAIERGLDVALPYLSDRARTLIDAVFSCSGILRSPFRPKPAIVETKHATGKLDITFGVSVDTYTKENHKDDAGTTVVLATVDIGDGKDAVARESDVTSSGMFWKIRVTVDVGRKECFFRRTGCEAESIFANDRSTDDIADLITYLAIGYCQRK
jgi:hypothetical protein